MNRIIDISPSTNLISTISKSGYKLETAIADLLDNSIYAEAKNIRINFEWNDMDPFVEIIDDGKGMPYEDLENSLKYACKDLVEERDVLDLGRFGLGLKSASSAISNKLTVSSYNKHKHTVMIDFQEVKNEKKWQAHDISGDAIEEKLNHTGTIVKCSRLKFINPTQKNAENHFYSKIEIVEIFLNKVFYEFIKKGLNIYINDNKLTGWTPFFKHDATRIVFNNCYQYNNRNINITIYILPIISRLNTNEILDIEGREGKSMTDLQGFYIYRADRLIYSGGWLDLPDIKLNEKYKYARIKVDIPNSLDNEFGINFMKNTASIPQDLVRLFLDLAKKAQKESNNNYLCNKDPKLGIVRKSKKDDELIWKQSSSNNGIVLTINEKHPLIENLCSSMTEFEKKRLFKLLSKNIPIGEIQNKKFSVKEELTDVEIIEMLKDQYEKMKNLGMEIELIKKKISKVEPFNNKLELVIKFFADIEGGQQ